MICVNSLTFWSLVWYPQQDSRLLATDTFYMTVIYLYYNINLTFTPQVVFGIVYVPNDTKIMTRGSKPTKQRTVVIGQHDTYGRSIQDGRSDSVALTDRTMLITSTKLIEWEEIV